MDDSSVNIDQQLLNAYRNTIYWVEDLTLNIQIGIENPALDAFLQKQQAKCWAFITAWNPRSKLLLPEENAKRHECLVALVEQAGYSYFMGKGIGIDPNWEPERSLFILNIPKANAIAIGKYFDQNAIVFGKLYEFPALLITADF